MNSSLFLALALLLAAHCASRAVSRADERAGSNRNARLAWAGAAPVAEVGDAAREHSKQQEVPPEFKEVDFKNLSYPIGGRRQRIQLKDGRYEYYEDKILEGNGWFDLQGVGYADLTGDGREEAIVRISWVSCGASCDGGSHLIYIYSIRQHKLTPIWRIETGSLAYGCGLKSFVVDGRTMTFEAFRACRHERSYLVEEPSPNDGRPMIKFEAKEFTRFLYEFDGQTFAPKKREVFPNPRENVMSFSPTISTGHD